LTKLFKQVNKTVLSPQNTFSDDSSGTYQKEVCDKTYQENSDYNQENSNDTNGFSTDAKNLLGAFSFQPSEGHITSKYYLSLN